MKDGTVDLSRSAAKEPVARTAPAAPLVGGVVVTEDGCLDFGKGFKLGDTGVTAPAKTVTEPTLLAFTDVPAAGAPNSPYDFAIGDPIEQFREGAKDLVALIPKLGPTGARLQNFLDAMRDMPPDGDKTDLGLRKSTYDLICRVQMAGGEIISDWLSGKLPEPPADLKGQLQIALMMIGCAGSSMNQVERMGAKNLADRTANAESLLHLATSLSSPLSAQVQAGKFTGPGADAFCHEAGVTIKDNQMVSNETGKAMTPAEIDHLGAHTLTSVLGELDDAARDIVEAEALFLEGLNDAETEGYQQFKQRFDDARKGLQAQNGSEAIEDGVMRHLQGAVEDGAGDNGIGPESGKPGGGGADTVTPEFVASLMDGQVPLAAMSDSQKAFVTSLGAFAVVKDGQVHVDVPPSERRRLLAGVRMMMKPKSTAAVQLRGHLVKGFAAAFKAERLASVLGTSLRALFAFRSLGLDVLGRHAAKNGTKSTKDDKGKHAIIFGDHTPDQKPKRGAGSPSSSMPTAAAATQKPQEALFAKRMAAAPQEEADEAKRQFKQRDAAIRLDDAADRAAYQAALVHDGLERRHDARVDALRDPK